jgi:hypothetical protein
MAWKALIRTCNPAKRVKYNILVMMAFESESLMVVDSIPDKGFSLILIDLIDLILAATLYPR